MGVEEASRFVDNEAATPLGESLFFLFLHGRARSSVFFALLLESRASVWFLLLLLLLLVVLRFVHQYFARWCNSRLAWAWGKGGGGRAGCDG